MPPAPDIDVVRTGSAGLTRRGGVLLSAGGAPKIDANGGGLVLDGLTYVSAEVDPAGGDDDRALLWC